MATLKDVLAATAHVRDCTGDPLAWRVGLGPDQVNLVLVPLNGFTATPAQLDAILATIHRRHPALFNPTTGAPITPPRSQPPSPTTPGGDSGEPQRGAAAESMKRAEAALALQNSGAAEFDRLMLEAIVTAHKTTEDGRRRLDELESDLEAAVTARNLETPMGARDFQRYLIGRLKDILAVVAEANDSDASRKALLAALAALYVPDADVPDTAGDSSRPAPENRPDEPAGVGDAPAEPVGFDGGLDAFPGTDGVTGEPAAAPPAPVPAAPSLGGLPGGAPALGLPLAGPPPAAEPYRESKDVGRSMLTPDDLIGEDEDDLAPGGSDEDPAADETTTEPAAGPTTVTLPNGDTVTAASPQLAAVIKSAAEGTPIADAFRQQGITIPPPGTAVAQPIDPAQVIPGDIGMFSDRHALAIGNDNALLDGQIQRIANVNGPSFLGWQHPPVPAMTAPTTTDPAATETPAPTRPSATA